MKKFFLTMLLSVFTLTQMSAITVYAKFDGDALNIYYWGNASTSWPGVAMDKKYDANGDTWFTKTVNASNIIFNLGSGKHQTANITDVTSDAAYIVTDGASSLSYTTTSIPTGLTDAPVEPIVTPDNMYVLGTLNGWSNTGANAMTKNGDVFTFTGTFPDSGDGFSWFSFISTLNSDWGVVNSNRFGPESNGEVVVAGTQANVTGKGDLSFKIAPGEYTLTYDFQAQTLDVTANAPIPESLSLRGSFNEWGETPMTQGNDGKWTITQEMEAGAKFKFYNENGAWIGGDSNGNFVVSKEQVENGTELTLVVNGGNDFEIPVAGTWTLTVDKANNKLVISGTWPEETPEEALYLAGSMTDWSEEKEALVKGNDGKWSITKEMEANAEFKFIDENGAWIGGVAEGNFVITKEQVEEGTELTLLVGGGNNFQIPVAGTWTLTVDKENNKLVVSGTWVEETPEEALYLAGSMTNWDEEKEALVKGNDGKWSITKEMDANAEFKFIDENGAWIGGVAEGNFVITKEQVEEGTELTLLVGGGNNFQIPVAGTWTLTVDKENNKLVVSGEWPVEIITVQGVVTDTNNQPIEGVNVTITVVPATPAGMMREPANDTFTGMTDAEGKYSIDVTPQEGATYNVTFAKENYVTQTLENVDLQNVPAVQLDEETITVVNDINAAQHVVSVKYINTAGQVSDAPFQGINIVVTRLADGSQTTTKIVK